MAATGGSTWQRWRKQAGLWGSWTWVPKVKPWCSSCSARWLQPWLGAPGASQTSAGTLAAKQRQGPGGWPPWVAPSGAWGSFLVPATVGLSCATSVFYFQAETLLWVRTGRGVPAASRPRGCGTVRYVVGFRREMCVSWVQLTGHRGRRALCRRLLIC